MSSPWLGVTTEGERSLRLVNRLVVLVRKGRATARTLGPLAGPRYREDLNEVGLVRAWSILDAYLTDRADVLSRREMPIPSVPSIVMVNAHEAALGGVRGSFERLQNYWNTALGVKLSEFPDWQRLSSMKGLRNVLTHGSGYIRPRVGGKPYEAWVLSRLKAFGLPASYAGKIPVEDSDFDKLAADVRALVLWLDARRP